MKAKRTRKAAPAEIARVGKDEMNLAEFPITILTNRAPEGVKTLHYHDHHGELTITGSDALGLPTAIDADVIVALIELTKKRNDFTEQTVPFTRYELIRLMDWANVGSSYARVEESLNRWAGVLLIYDGCWWDNKTKRYVSKTFHIIESFILADGKTKTIKDGRQASLPLSSFTWSKDFIRSCQDNNLKDLDTELYFSLKLPTSKQLFRFLGKRFYRYPELELDLAEVALERVGLSRSYSGNAAKLKEKLADGIKELETRGFLKPLTREERFFKSPEGWKIRLIDGRGSTFALPPAPPATEPEPPPLVAELVQRGVARKTAAELVRDYPAEKIQLQIEILDYRLAGKKAAKIDEPAAYLIGAIKSEDGYTAPKGFISTAERQRREEARQARERQEAEERRCKQEEEAREREERKAIAAHWEALTPEEQAELQAQADAQADPESLKNENYPPLKRMGQQIRRNEYIRDLLRSREQVPEEA